MAKIVFKMVKENFEFQLSQVTKIVFELTNMTRENFEFQLKWLKLYSIFKLSTMVRENFEFHLSEMTKIVFKAETFTAHT